MIANSLVKRLDFRSVQAATASVLGCDAKFVLTIDEYLGSAFDECVVGVELRHESDEYQTASVIDLGKKYDAIAHDFALFFAKYFECKVTTFIYSDNHGPLGEDSLVVESSGEVFLGISSQEHDTFIVAETQSASGVEWLRDEISLKLAC
jgi:hypothetical protein